ncbi:MAG: SPFH domain-containing protein [Micrococcaceae bacterium]
MVVIAILVITIIAGAVKIVPQARTGIVERLGRYQRTQGAGLTMIIPFVDRMLPLMDMREQVVSFPPQPVITEDNLVVSIDTVVYFQVNDAKLATYGIANYIHAVENLTTTTLRNVVGGMNLEEALTSRDSINSQLRGVLDEATNKWGLRVSRVELKAIDPPPSIQDSMEKQMRAERDRRAAILTAEGTKQAEILTAEGSRQAAILAAEGDAQAQILRANAEAEAITSVFEAIHDGRPDPDLLAYQYLQTLPKLAEGDSNKLWIIPSEFTDALTRMGSAFSGGENPLDTLRDAASGGSTQSSSQDDGDGEKQQDRRRRRSKPTTAAEIADIAPKAPKLSETSLEEALADSIVDDASGTEPPKELGNN